MNLAPSPEADPSEASSDSKTQVTLRGAEVEKRAREGYRKIR